MPTFDFITVKEFRESLEADRKEMLACAEAQAWKSVHVLSGSIVESLLIDYLISTPNPSRPAKDPLKVDLGEAIALCRSEGALTDRTADLCSVIRSYRNLIHPGRRVRLGEHAPDRGSSSIALVLVDMISDEIARARRTAVGWTAEQMLSKIVRDDDVLTILNHLLKEVNDHQRERLLIGLLPKAHERSRRSDEELIDPFDDITGRLESAYRLILDSSPPMVRVRVASEYVRVLREEDGATVRRYGDAFFRPSDLRHVAVEHQDMVKEHLLARMPQAHNVGTMKQFAGYGEYATPQDVPKWIDPFVRALVSSAVAPNVKQEVRTHLLEEIDTTTSEVYAAIRARFDDWAVHYEKADQTDAAATVRAFRDELVLWHDLSDPFAE